MGHPLRESDGCFRGPDVLTTPDVLEPFLLPSVVLSPEPGSVKLTLNGGDTWPGVWFRIGAGTNWSSIHAMRGVSQLSLIKSICCAQVAVTGDEKPGFESPSTPGYLAKLCA